MSSLTPSTINPCFPKTSQLQLASSHKNHPIKTQISCKTAENNETQDNNHPNSNSSTSRVVDRRNMLIGLGGLYGVASATSTGGIPASLAAPAIPEVDNNCLTTENWNAPGSANFQCCLNFKDKQIREFDLSTITSGKIRQPAHQVTPEYLDKFKAAIDAMRALPDNDPRSLNMQAFIHCAYCDGVYYQVPKESQIRYFVHNYWLFAAFHRWELFFFERIAGELIGDPYFTLPYWAWDNREGMTVPDIYEDRCSPLYDSTRSSRVKNNSVVDLSYIPGRPRDPPLNDEDLKIENLKLMYSKMVDVMPSNFYGAQYKAGDVVAKKDQPDNPQQAGYIENGAHNSIHGWVGGNMGKYATAGRDPLFYGLHANVDRMWNVWSKRWGMNDDYTNNDDYKNASFVFYDRDGDPVRVYARDCFDIENLGYAYKPLYLEWLNYPPGNAGGGANPGGPGGRGPGGRGPGGRGPGGRRPGGRGPGGRGPGGRGPRGPFGGPRPVAWNTVVAPMAPFQLDSIVQTEVQRPHRSSSEAEKKAEEEEVIVIDMNVSHTNDEMIKYDVYINDEYEHDPEERTLITPEYAGSFTMLPMNHGGDHQHKAVLKLQLNRLLQDIGADDDDTLAVTLVPRIGQDAVVITGVKIDYINE